MTSVYDHPGGYKYVYDRRRHTNKSRCVLLHRLRAAEALGKPLPPGVQVHHAESKDNNEALVICPGAAYHKLLHQRQAALEACGNPSWRRCSYCQTYDAPDRMYLVGTKQAYHTACRQKHRRARTALRRAS